MGLLKTNYITEVVETFRFNKRHIWKWIQYFWL